MAVSKGEFLSLFDEFSGLDARQVGVFLRFAERRIDRNVWGDCADEACLYLAAHLVASLAGGDVSAAGPVTAKTTGSLSRSYGQINVASGGDETFGLTRYGLLFLELRRSCIVPAMVTCETVPGFASGKY